ncbi:MAG: hypothetical protein ACR2NO_09690 [Chloroflexota bacterium]
MTVVQALHVIAAASLVLVATASCGGGISAAPGVTAVAGGPAGTASSDGLARDGAGYAAEYGVSQDEAEARIRAQLAQGEVARQLESLLPGRLAGVWLEHVPQFRMVAWYTGDDSGLEAVRLVAKQASIPVEIRTGATHSLEALLEISERVVTAVQADAEIAGIWPDVRTGVVHVELQPGGPSAADAVALGDALSAQFGVAVQLDVLATRAGDDIG